MLLGAEVPAISQGAYTMAYFSNILRYATRHMRCAYSGRIVERSGEAAVRNTATAWGEWRFGEQPPAHPYLTVAVLLLGVMLLGGCVLWH